MRRKTLGHTQGHWPTGEARNLQHGDSIKASKESQLTKKQHKLLLSTWHRYTTLRATTYSFYHIFAQGNWVQRL